MIVNVSNFNLWFCKVWQKLEEVTVECADWAFFCSIRESHSKDKQ